MERGKGAPQAAALAHTAAGAPVSEALPATPLLSLSPTAEVARDNEPYSIALPEHLTESGPWNVRR